MSVSSKWRGSGNLIYMRSVERGHSAKVPKHWLYSFATTSWNVTQALKWPRPGERRNAKHPLALSLLRPAGRVIGIHGTHLRNHQFLVWEQDDKLRHNRAPPGNKQMLTEKMKSRGYMTINTATNFHQRVSATQASTCSILFIYLLHLNMHPVLSLNTKSPTASLL